MPATQPAQRPPPKTDNGYLVLQDWRGTSTLELEDDLTLTAFEIPAPSAR